MKFGSVCSGIEAASVAWEPLGWKAAFVSEIDAFPRAVLAHHYPTVPLHGDFTTIQADDYAAINVLVGGTPCQSFSVAGLRAGLADARGNLALEFCLLARRLRPKWIVWENVPGVLSLDGGRAFASILGGLAECGYGLAYRVLDAQYVRVDGFGRAVPQRRRRVFVVGCLGDWRGAAAVLFERQGMSWDSPPRRQPGQRPAPTLSARTEGGGGLGTDFEVGGGLIPLNALNGASHSLAAARGGSKALDATMETYLGETRPLNDLAGASHALTATATATATGHLDPTTQDLLGVTHALRADGFDASEDGTGRGTPLVPICFSAKDYGADAMTNLSPTLRAGGFDKSHANAGVMPAIAFRTTGNDGCYDTGDVAASMPTGTDPNWLTLLQSWRVRRLMPVECERLQGFPDGYTDVPYRNKRAADGPRYKALGNSMAVNCMRWIGTRIATVDKLQERAAK